MKIPTVCCVIVLNREKELLFVKRARDPYKNKWSLIGGIGYSQKGFSLEEGVEEEIRGDVGVEPISQRYLFESKYKNQKVSIFEALIENKKIKTQLPYTNDYIWCNKNEIDKLGDLAFDNKKVLERYLKSETS